MAEKTVSSSTPEVCDKVVLICRGKQKKPVSFSSDGTPGERQALHAAIRVAYGGSHPAAESPVIQMKNEQWDGFLWTWEWRMSSQTELSYKFVLWAVHITVHFGCCCDS